MCISEENGQKKVKQSQCDSHSVFNPRVMLQELISSYMDSLSLKQTKSVLVEAT